MNDGVWIVPAAIGIIVGAPVAALIVLLVVEHRKARRNRSYKSLEEHVALNAADLSLSTTGRPPPKAERK